MRFIEVCGQDDWGVMILERHYRGRQLLDLWNDAMRSANRKIELELESEKISVIAHDLDVTQDEYELMGSIWGDVDNQRGWDILPVGRWKSRGTTKETGLKAGAKRAPRPIAHRFLEISFGATAISAYPVSILTQLWEKANTSESRTLVFVVAGKDSTVWTETVGSDRLVAVEKSLERVEGEVRSHLMALPLEAFQKFAGIWRKEPYAEYHDLVPIDVAKRARRKLLNPSERRKR